MLHIIAITMQHGMCYQGNREKSPCVQNVCFLNAECGGGVHTPGYDPSFSIRLYVLGEHNNEYSLPTPPIMDHLHHIAQFVWSNW